MKTTHPLLHSILCATGLAAVGVTGQASAADIELINTSTRAVVTPETPTSIHGLGIAMGDESPEAQRWMLVRVLGPALAEFGVADPLMMPEALLYSGNDLPIQLGYDHRVFPEIVYPDGTTPQGRFHDALRRATEISGAVPVPIADAGQPVPEARDLVDLIQLGPGGHTIHAHSGDSQASGSMLVETYVLPEDFDPQLEPDEIVE